MTAGAGCTAAGVGFPMPLKMLAKFAVAWVFVSSCLAVAAAAAAAAAAAPPKLKLANGLGFEASTVGLSVVDFGVDVLAEPKIAFCCASDGVAAGVDVAIVFGVLFSAPCNAAIIVGLALDGGVTTAILPFLMCCGGMMTLMEAWETVGALIVDGNGSELVMTTFTGGAFSTGALLNERFQDFCWGWVWDGTVVRAKGCADDTSIGLGNKGGI